MARVREIVGLVGIACGVITTMCGCGGGGTTTPAPLPDAPADTTLFVLPLYQLADPSNTSVTALFRSAYCAARVIGYKEDFTLLFNTAFVKGSGDYTGIGATYLTRESFKDADGANLHLKHFSTVPIHNAFAFASPSGFALLGSDAELDKMLNTSRKFNADTYVIDSRSFRRTALDRAKDYFADDIFLKLNAPTDLEAFKKTWGQLRELASKQPGILSFGMGVQHSADRKTVTVYLKEYYEDADAYLAWQQIAGPDVETLLTISSIVTKPNPPSMTGHAAELAKAADKCEATGCVQYTIDDCNIADVVVV